MYDKIHYNIKNKKFKKINKIKYSTKYIYCVCYHNLAYDKLSIIIRYT